MIKTPTKNEVDKYLKQWDVLDNYVSQENSLDKLFHVLLPNNKEIEDILIKASTLNDFYSTNILSIFPVANNILKLDIDKRLKMGDASLIADIGNVEIKGKHKYFYSFATKYCSHHNPDDFPIFDSYVEKMLCYFRKKDAFAKFSKKELKDYKTFKNILIEFSEHYNLQAYSLKKLDRYLWQLGKESFPKSYPRKKELQKP